eukprot:IDg5745t1
MSSIPCSFAKDSRLASILLKLCLPSMGSGSLKSVSMVVSQHSDDSLRRPFPVVERSLGGSLCGGGHSGVVPEKRPTSIVYRTPSLRGAECW